MTRDLLLLRSAKGARNWPGSTESRPLRDKGKRQAQRVGVWLAEQGQVPKLVFAANSERAVVSAQKALKSAGAGAHGIKCDNRLSGLDRHGPLDVLRECRNVSGLVMLVLDKDALRDLLDHLVPGDPQTATTGTLVRLQLPDDWSDLPTGCGRVVSVVVPKDLPKRFPFDGPDGREWRVRPAYYYSQSAILPFRNNQGRTEVLLIGSSKQSHWVIPKGIHEPGFSAQESAAREAREEAGILGDVGSEPIGTFELFKWGASCRVSVFAMAVTRVLAEREWEESHRKRIWVSPAEAVERLKDEGLKGIVAEFAATRGQSS